jgi:hypothetical protein
MLTAHHTADFIGGVFSRISPLVVKHKAIRRKRFSAAEQ